jgi:hypothetical protein
MDSEMAATTIVRVRPRVAAFGALWRVLRYSTPVLLVVALGTGSLGGPAIAGGPFEQFAGTWSGKGKVTFEGGNSEALACTAYYVSRDAGAGLGLAIRCASTSYKTEIRSSLHHANGKVSGAWEERSFNAAGAASGMVSSGRISLQISGAINGSMTIVQAGSNQSVSISTTGGGLSAVSIGLSPQRSSGQLAREQQHAMRSD